jgi:hypothetical protein
MVSSPLMAAASAAIADQVLQVVAQVLSMDRRNIVSQRNYGIKSCGPERGQEARHLLGR